MKEEASNGLFKKIALISIFLIFLVGTVSATCDLYVDSLAPDYRYNDVIFANEGNPIQIVVCNNDTDDAVNNTIFLWACGVGPVACTTVPVIQAGTCTDVVLTDPTVRNVAGETTTYVAVTVSETLDSNYFNNWKSESFDIVFNGYKGKRYWNDTSDIETKRYYELDHGNMTCYTQPQNAYMSTSWTTRSEVWTTSNLQVPAGAEIEAAWLYISYNWDNSGGIPDFDAEFNGNPLTLGTPYIDMSNMGTYGSKRYGLFSVDVTNEYIQNNDNTLDMERNTDNQALYPSTLVVIYEDENETQKLIFMNEECDELLVSDATHKYGTTMDEATAYAPFTGPEIDIEEVSTATLYSFAGSAGPDEGNLLFNEDTIATSAWQGSSYTASPLVSDVTASLDEEDNEAAIQGTSYGGMLALQQILVIDFL